MTKKELLREAAEDCVELSNYLVNDAPNMGFTKEKSYREQAAQCLKRAEELNKWADSLPVEPEEKQASAEELAREFWPTVQDVPCFWCGVKLADHEKTDHGWRRGSVVTDIDVALNAQRTVEPSTERHVCDDDCLHALGEIAGSDDCRHTWSKGRVCLHCGRHERTEEPSVRTI